MIVRKTSLDLLAKYTSYFPVTAIVGPRQCGKTTLAKAFLGTVPDSLYLDLERPADLAKLAHPEDFLQPHSERLVCLDEIQRTPELFPVLRSLCDAEGGPGQFLVLGSASPTLLRQTSETLAGRIAHIELTPFREHELGVGARMSLWDRGGFPGSYLAPDDELSRAWLDNFILTFLERDIPQLGIHVPSLTLRRFWQMCAHFHGETWNHAKIAGSLGVSGTTAAHYLDILEGAYMLRRIPSFAANVKKRLVKAPRVYLRDTGILHRLLRIDTHDDLLAHPVYGASWESYVIEQVAAALPDAELSYYRTAAGTEMDLVVTQGRRMTVLEMKGTVAPKLTRGFWTALDDLKPDSCFVVAPVESPYSLAKGVVVAPPDVAIRHMQGTPKNAE
ncbi:MAG: ATP-binding protein [Lentisphaeria bacterium]|nr:ATP-binding protein [Lentisphaeria bacterium]